MAFALDGFPLSSPEGQFGFMRKPNKEKKKDIKTNIYHKVTVKNIADLEKGELPRLKPWNAGNLKGSHDELVPCAFFYSNKWITPSNRGIKQVCHWSRCVA